MQREKEGERERTHTKIIMKKKIIKEKIQKNFPKLKGVSFRLIGSTTYLLTE